MAIFCEADSSIQVPDPIALTLEMDSECGAVVDDGATLMGT
jgi:hypothetical protein